MKADTHPDYHEITVVMTDGKEYKTRSTYGKEGDVIKLDVDPLTHPAWQGGTGKIVEKGQLSKFEKRFGNFGLVETESKPAPKAKAEETAQPAEEETQETVPEEEVTEEAAPAEEVVAEEATAEETEVEDKE